MKRNRRFGEPVTIENALSQQVREAIDRVWIYACAVILDVVTEIRPANTASLPRRFRGLLPRNVPSSAIKLAPDTIKLCDPFGVPTSAFAVVNSA